MASKSYDQSSNQNTNYSDEFIILTVKLKSIIKHDVPILIGI